jgi:hypothetical protein
MREWVSEWVSLLECVNILQWHGYELQINVKIPSLSAIYIHFDREMKKWKLQFSSATPFTTF